MICPGVRPPAISTPWATSTSPTTNTCSSWVRRSIIEHPSVRVGIGEWGPHLKYPLHEHEAEELYHVLAGTPAFGTRTEPGPTRSRATPSTTAVAPACAAFGAEPTVLLYCWTGAVEADAVLVER